MLDLCRPVVVCEADELTRRLESLIGHLEAVQVSDHLVGVVIVIQDDPLLVLDASHVVDDAPPEPVIDRLARASEQLHAALGVVVTESELPRLERESCLRDVPASVLLGLPLRHLYLLR